MPPKPSALPPQVVQITHGSSDPTAIGGPPRHHRPVRFPFDPASVELGSDEAAFVITATPTPLQARAFALLGLSPAGT